MEIYFEIEGKCYLYYSSGRKGIFDWGIKALDFVKGMRENLWISLKIFTVTIPFLLDIFGLILIFIWDLSATTLFFFFALHNWVDNQVAIRGGCFPSRSFIFQAL